MIEVAICDDTPSDRVRLAESLSTVADELHVATHIVQFESVNVLLSSPWEHFNLIFLDIEMAAGDLDGMSAARIIRDKNPQVTLVFVTNYLRYAPEGYAVNAYRYIIKPVQTPQLALEMHDLLPKLNKSKSRSDICLKIGSEVIVLRKNQIAYIETSPGKNVTFHTAARNLTHHSPLSHWENQLAEDDFFRCHASYLVNLAFISCIEKASVALSLGDTVPLSKHRRRELIGAFANYLGDQL